MQPRQRAPWYVAVCALHPDSLWFARSAVRLACGHEYPNTCEHGKQVTRTYGLPRQSILRATLRREITLVKRNAFIYGFRCACSVLCIWRLQNLPLSELPSCA